MNTYESIFILRPSVLDEEVVSTIAKFHDVVQRHGGTVIASENIGKKKLAYEVKKETRGIYILSHFMGNGTTVFELERGYRLSEMVIKSMVVRVDPKSLQKPAPISEGVASDKATLTAAAAK